MKMREILEKYKDSNIFSLTTWCTVTDHDYFEALSKEKNYYHDKLEEKYDKRGLLDIFNDQFQSLVNDCEQGLGYSEVNNKYGLDEGLLFNTYMPISIVTNNYDRKGKHSKDAKPYVNYLPEVLKNNLIEYKVSFHNEVTEGSDPMVIYFFKLNDETKEYLLQYETDFDLDELQDLVLYKDKELLFYSSTHEGYNSLTEY